MAGPAQFRRDEVAADAETDYRHWLATRPEPPRPTPADVLGDPELEGLDDLEAFRQRFLLSADREADRFESHLNH